MVQGDGHSNDLYYGVIRDVYELQYPGENHVVVLKCNWYDMQHEGRGYKVDEYGITSIHRGFSLKIDEPFVLESQVEQVFYVQDPRHDDWNVVIKIEPRDLYSMPKGEEERVLDQSDDEVVQEGEIQGSNYVLQSIRHMENVSLATNHFKVERGEKVIKWVTSKMKSISQRREGCQGKRKKRKKKNSDLDDFIVANDVED